MFKFIKHDLGVALAVVLTVIGGQLLGYKLLENDRVLLMNNDTKSGAAVTCQGYNDTDKTKKTYWVHDTTAAALTIQNMLKGTNHQLYKNDGTLLWDLRECRAGSGTLNNNAQRNYIPWSSTAQPLKGTSLTAAQVGSVILRNTSAARVYSPYYEDGIGVIYLDAVNAFTTIPVGIALEYAVEAKEGYDLKTSANNDTDLLWQPIKFDVFTVKGNAVELLESGVTNLVLNSTGGKNTMFYRVRANLNERGPVKFRIRRLDDTGVTGNAMDTSGIALIDNIVVSYPAMTANLLRYGLDYDETLTGSSVQGCIGDLTVAFPSANENGVKPFAGYELLTNSAIANPVVTISNPQLVYRWRYLNQITNDWKVIPFEIAENQQLVTDQAINLSDGVGDIEYFFRADVDAPYYEVQDYAFDNSPGFGEGWTEKIFAVTNRASYPIEVSPSAGSDYFVRVRAGKSNFSEIKVVGKGMKYDVKGETNAVENVEARMELVADHLWRYHYYMTTNVVGEKLTFHFEGNELRTRDDGYGFRTIPFKWFSQEGEITALPYTSVAVTGARLEASVTLDSTCTHLMIEFNDSTGAFSVSRASYQDFNKWTDAVKGFAGYTDTMTDAEGNETVVTNVSTVSDLKRGYTVDFNEWSLALDSDANWIEQFEIFSGDPGFPADSPFGSHRTPNGWTAYNGMFVYNERIAKSKLAFQMEGRGRGMMALDKLGESAMPDGVGTVKFSARVAQSRDFGDFAWYVDGTTFTNYAVSAKIAMSRSYNSKNVRSPLDMSTAQPSISFVAYYRPYKGCYEFRITRTGDKELTYNLYKWSFDGDTQTVKQLGTGGKKTNASDADLLVVTSQGRGVASSGYLSVRNTPAGTVIKCGLLDGQNGKAVQSEIPKKVYEYTDNDSPLTKGSFGVGSVDCSAIFGQIAKHELTAAGEISSSLSDITSAKQSLKDGDWAYSIARYGDTSKEGTLFQDGLRAIMPENQTVTLQYSTPGRDDNAWKDYEGIAPIVINSFSTNSYEFVVQSTNTSYVAIKTGGSANDSTRTDVVVDNVQVTSWRAPDSFNLENDMVFAAWDEWVYTEGWLETAAQVSGGTYKVNPVTGTDEYVYIFDQAGSTVNIKPKKEIVITEVLALSGSGIVATKEFPNGYVVATNKTVTVIVGPTNKVSEVQGLGDKITAKADEATESVTSNITGAEIEYGGKPGNGVVIIRVRSADKALVLQPSRGTATYPMSLRSPYLTAGLSMFSFSYQDADTNAVLHLQLCTNIQNVASAQSYTRDRTYSMNSNDWVTIETFNFKGLTKEQLKRGTFAHYMSLREPYHGMMRLLVDTNVKLKAIETKNPNYGAVTITAAYCYDEPKRDNRSWWGWNIHTHGWGADGASSEWAYLTDSPDGLSCILNFSASSGDNRSAAAKGLGLLVDDDKAYAIDNPFIQSAPLECGVGAVRFRARTFDPSNTEGSDTVVILYGSADPEAAQTIRPDDWKKIAEFTITNKTYASYEWVSTADSSPYKAVRLEVAGARHGRQGTGETWETPANKNYLPRQRVCIDEMTVSEPIVPRVALREVCVFRSGLTDLEPTIIDGVSTNLSEQPIIGESWGIYARVEPQQMSDDMDLDSVVVTALVYRSSSPWGYNQWSNKVDHAFEIPRVGKELVFRSCASRPDSILEPITEPGSIVQYVVCAYYKDKEGISHKHILDSVDWQTPSWYWPQDYNQKYGGGLEDRFSAYSLFDSVSPKRAWINEVNLSDGTKSDNTLYGANCQYIEIAAPAGADLTGWSVNVLGSQVKRGQIVQIGFGACADSTMKTRNAKDHFIFYAIQSPLTRTANTLEGNADGAWSSALDSPGDFGMNGDASMTGSRAYGIELVRPTGVIEHQIVIAGTNILAGGFLEYLGSGTNLLETLKKKDHSGNEWFYTGEDRTTGTLGVISGHGENETSWTNRLDVYNQFNPEKIQGTPGKINSFGGVEQTITPNWFLAPNGTNVWIYPSIEGGNLVQILGNKVSTSSVIVIQKGSSTNIQYLADKWFELGDVKVGFDNNLVSTNFYPLGNRRYEIRLENVQTNMDVIATAKVAESLETQYGLTKENQFTPAIMDWLLKEHSANENETIHLAKVLDLKHNYVTNMTLTGMYMLNINPVEEGWALVFGFGAMPTVRRSASPIKAFVPIEVDKDKDGNVVTNTTMIVTMMITNQNTGVAYAPNTLRGVEPGSVSSNLTDQSASSWTSTTFKVVGALQRPGDQYASVRKNYLPLRWFVFGPNSFDPVTFTAQIEILEPHQTNSPGYWYGWDQHPEVPIWYKLKLDGEGPRNDSAKVLKAKDIYDVK